MIQESLSDDHFYKISVSHEFITLSVSVNAYRRTIIRNTVLYRISYNKVTKKYAVPIVNLLSQEIYKKLLKALSKYKPKSETKISVHMQGNMSGDPTTIKPKIVKMEINKPIVQIASGVGIAIQLLPILIPLGCWVARSMFVLYHWKTNKTQTETKNTNYLIQGVSISEVEGVSHE